MPPDLDEEHARGPRAAAGGLTTAEAERRLAGEGPNEPPEPRRRSTVGRVGDQLRDPMILLLQGAAVLSAALHDWSSTGIIVAVVVLNTTVGVVQQYRADRVMTELRRLAAPSALARRDGVLAALPASGLVRGDEVVLAGGDLVPARGRGRCATRRDRAAGRAGGRGSTTAGGPPQQRRGLTVVARVLPEQKVHVVEWLQEAGEVVAMLGDGVNDAPALRRADIGVAAGRTGSEVAKEAADLVLNDDELGSVVAAVEEGRRLYANIRAFLLYAVSGGLAEVGVMMAGSLAASPCRCSPGRSCGSTCSRTVSSASRSAPSRSTPAR